MEDATNRVFTEIEIRASADEVWRVLTDWKKLKEWSSSFVGISTERLVKGEKFIAYFRNPLTGKNIEFERICYVYEEGKRFGWSGSIIGNTYDNHIFTIAAIDENLTVFKQEDGLHGKHSKLMNFLAEHHMKAMYQKFNKELKERVESINQ